MILANLLTPIDFMSLVLGLFWIAISLFVAWLSLYISEKKPLSELGLLPSQDRIGCLFKGLFVSAIICIAYISTDYYLLAHTYSDLFPFLSPGMSFWVSHELLIVIAKEIFKASILYILAIRLGVCKSVIVLASVYGLAALASSTVIDRPVALLLFEYSRVSFALHDLILICAFALAYTRSENVYLPIGLHMGWQLAHTLLVGGMYGDFFIQSSRYSAEFSNDTSAYLLSEMNLIAYPLILILYVDKFVKVERVQFTRNRVISIRDTLHRMFFMRDK